MKTEDRGNIDALLAALARIFAGEGRAGGRQASRALDAARGGRFLTRPGGADPGALIESACSAQHGVPAAALVASTWSLLAWSTWGEGELDAAVSAGLYTTELVGPDGHFEAPGVRVGLLVSAPGIDYPLSSHAGEETYYVLSGIAEWRLADANPERRTPGAYVHHPAWTPHGRRTLEQAFLGAWRWSGDLDLDSFSVAN